MDAEQMFCIRWRWRYGLHSGGQSRIVEVLPDGLYTTGIFRVRAEIMVEIAGVGSINSGHGSGFVGYVLKVFLR